MLVSTTNAAAVALDATLKTAEAGKVPARDLVQPRQTAKDAAATLQKARASIKAGAYLAAIESVKGLEPQIRAQIRTLESLPPARGPRRADRSR
jgi:hypothetical protein